MKSPNEIISTAPETDFDLNDNALEMSPAAGPQRDEPGNFRLLPRTYGTPIVCALVRNPTSLFVFWEIEWPAFFARTAPRNREVYLRVHAADGSEISKTLIEPMAGHLELPVPNSDTGYRVELGYIGVDQSWHSVGKANAVETPADSLNEPGGAIFATVPFHLSFQRLTELFNQSSSRNRPIVERLARIQEKALRPEASEQLTSVEEQIFRAVDAELPEGWQEAARKPAAAINLEKRVDEILGFGASSAENSLGGSSRTR